MDANANSGNGKPRRRWVWWAAGTAAALVVFVAAGGYFFVRQRFWTDDRTVRVPAHEAKPREVLWTTPEPLAAAFNTAEQEYEPSASPDGTELYFVRGKAGGAVGGDGDPQDADIHVSYRRDNQWTAPQPLEGVNGPRDDLGPRLTPDG